MKRSSILLSMTTALLMICVVTSRAQFAVGLGVGLIGLTNNMQQAGGKMQEQIKSGNYSYGDLSSLLGVSLKGRVKFGVGVVRIMGDLGYDFFPNSTVTLVRADSSKATFDVGTSMVPISAGVELPLSAGPLHPYVNVQAAVAFMNRTYVNAAFSGSGSLSNLSAGDNEIGMSIGAGVEFGLLGMWMNIGGQYHLTNLFSQSSGEKPMRYGEIGVSLFLGDLSK